MSGQAPDTLPTKRTSPRDSRRRARPAWTPLKAPVSVTERISSQLWALSRRSCRSGTLSAAAQTRMSSRSRAVMKRPTAARSVTSRETGPRRPTRCTWTPAASRRSAMAAPMPDEPPVTTATRPASSGKEDLDLVGRASGQPLESRRTVVERAHLAEGHRRLSPGQPVQRLPEVRVGVAEAPLHTDVGPDDAAPGQRCLVAVEADEAGCAGRSDQVDRRPAGVVGAGGIHNQGGARRHLGEVGESLLRPQRQGVLTPARVPLDDRPRAGAPQ